MATGTDTFEGLALPLLGSYQQEQQAIADDMVTLTGKASMSGDFYVCENSTGTELFIINKDGDIEATDLVLSGDVQGATLTCTGIGTIDYAAAIAGTYSYAVAGLTTDDVVLLSPRETTVGLLVVDLVASGELSIRGSAEETGNVECNYLVIAKA